MYHNNNEYVYIHIRIDSDGLLSYIECLVLVITSSPNIFGGLLSFLLSPILTAHPVDCTSERRRLYITYHGSVRRGPSRPGRAPRGRQ